MIYAVPLAMFLHFYDETRCGNSMKTGEVLIGSTDKSGHYIESVTELVDPAQNVVGWVYLAKATTGDTAEYVQANRQMSNHDLAVLQLRRSSQDNMSSIHRLGTVFPPVELHVRKCSSPLTS